MINKNLFNAIKRKLEAEAYECGKYGKVINRYRISFCKQANELVAQRLYKNGWVCLHD